MIQKHVKARSGYAPNTTVVDYVSTFITAIARVAGAVSGINAAPINRMLSSRLF